MFCLEINDDNDDDDDDDWRVARQDFDCRAKANGSGGSTSAGAINQFVPRRKRTTSLRYYLRRLQRGGTADMELRSRSALELVKRARSFVTNGAPSRLDIDAAKPSDNNCDDDDYGFLF